MRIETDLTPKALIGLGFNMRIETDLTPKALIFC